MLYYFYTLTEGLNLNSCYYETLEKNFNEAVALCESDFTHEELINMLENGNIPQKQIAALKLTEIKNATEANILLSNLTGQDGKIREAVSLRLAEFMNNPTMAVYFQSVNNYDIFLDAVVDINANICRNVISAISSLKNNMEFTSYFCAHLSKMIFELIDKIEQFDVRDGKYKVNKELFKLYWCLECVYEFYEYFDINTLKSILKRTQYADEYTIREKTAKILSRNIKDSELDLIKAKLKQDSNYYVKKY